MDEVSRVTTLRTLEHYDQRAEDFWRGTRDHDVRPVSYAHLTLPTIYSV